MTRAPEAPTVVAVLGGSAGIGRAVAEALAADGWRVAIGARGEERLGEAVDVVTRAGGVAVGTRVDVADPASVEAFFDASAAALGPIDAVVSCAAHAKPGRFWERDPAALAAEVGTGLTGALLVARAAASRMVTRGAGGDLLFLSSTTATVPWPYFTAYAAAKAGLEQAARVMAIELEGTGVRVGVVRVGNTVGTDWAAEWGAEEFGVAAEWSRFGMMRHDGFMQPADVARVVAQVLRTPRGVQLELVTVHPEAPHGEQRAPVPGTGRAGSG
jgi:NAD(P)-dependent dehydrogenase (short-subunit alcohol dehydrogenase family)